MALVAVNHLPRACSGRIVIGHFFIFFFFSFGREVSNNLAERNFRKECIWKARLGAIGWHHTLSFLGGVILCNCTHMGRIYYLYTYYFEPSWAHLFWRETTSPRRNYMQLTCTIVSQALGSLQASFDALLTM